MAGATPKRNKKTSKMVVSLTEIALDQPFQRVLPVACAEFEVIGDFGLAVLGVEVVEW
jgi:hypothetical protein